MIPFDALLNIDSLRFIFITSTVVALAIYTRFHLTAGGTVFAGFGAILTLTDRWFVFLWILFISALSFYLVRRLFANFLALPKNWIFFSLAITSTFLNGIAILLVRLLENDFLVVHDLIIESLDSFVIYGAYITPALLGYDLAKQSLKPTIVAFFLIASITTIATVPIMLISHDLAPGISTRMIEVTSIIPSELLWLAATVSILVGAFLRLSFRVSSGGFLGAFYLVEIFTVESFVAVGALAVITWIITTFLQKNLTLTPRQSSQIAFTLGGLMAWLGLYWGAFFNIESALEMNSYTLEPLLVVGLLASEMTRSRSNPVSVLTGTAIAASFVALTIFIALNYGTLVGLVFILFIFFIAMTPGFKDLKKTWQIARDSGTHVKLSNHDL
jgi:hypothetical protein